MPQAQGSAVITSASQILGGVIVNSHLAAGAAIAYSKLALTGNIVNADIATAAAIVATKLADIVEAGKISGAALTLLGNTPSGAGVLPGVNAPAASHLLEMITTAVSVSNTITETDLLSVSIPANTLGTGNAVRVRMLISNFTTNPTNGEITLRFKYGGTTIVTAADMQDDTGNSKGWIEFILAASGATNTQDGYTIIWAGREDISTDTNTAHGFQSDVGTATEDSTGALTIAVSAQHDFANASHTITMEGAIIEVLVA